MLLTAALIVMVTALPWLMFNRVAERVIKPWGQRGAGIQVRYAAKASGHNKPTVAQEH